MLRRAAPFYSAIVIAILALATLVRFADPFFVQALRLIAFDSYQLLAPAEYDPELPVRLVDVDEDSLERVGQWPWSRVTMAELLTRLRDQGAAVVAFDILFPEADRTSPEEAIKLLTPEEAAALAPLLTGRETHDSIFATAIAASPTVMATALSQRASAPPLNKAGFAIAGDDPRAFVRNYAGATRNLAALDEASPGLGSINWVPDRDQVIRRLPLVYRVGDQYVPTLITEALRIAQGAGTYVLKASNASGESAFGAQTGLNHVRVGAIEIPTDADGAIWLQFREKQPEAYIPAWQVLANENDAEQIAGAIVVLGTSAPGLMDLRATPLDASIPGFEVHGQALEHILRGSTITRPDYAIAVEIAVLVLLGIALAAVVPRLGAIAGGVFGIAVIGLMMVSMFVVYARTGFLIDASYPALVLFLLVSAITISIYRRSEQQKVEVRKAFGFYVAPTVVNEIIRNPDRLELGGEVRDLTLLFCDVRDFTMLSENLTAHELTRFINALLTPLSEIILENRGTIDKYMGDAIMAFWNAPLDDPEHASNAFRSALSMIRRMDDLNAVWAQEAAADGRIHTPVSIGIGINSGDCCVGNLGSSQRFDYSAIGDNVNVASRFEGLSKTYGVPVVLGDATLARLPGLNVLELDFVRVKGRVKPTRVHVPAEALGISELMFGRLALCHAAMLESYRAQAWEEAAMRLAECEQAGVSGLEKFHALYRRRIESFRAAPPAADWTGVYSAESK